MITDTMGRLISASTIISTILITAASSNLVTFASTYTGPAPWGSTSRPTTDSAHAALTYYYGISTALDRIRTTNDPPTEEPIAIEPITASSS